MEPPGNDPESSARNAPSSLPRAPWSRLAFAYAVGLALLEFVCISTSPALFRAVVVADAAVGWVVVLACWQGLRAMPYPPPMNALLISSLATGHWLAAVVGAAGAIGLLASQ